MYFSEMQYKVEKRKTGTHPFFTAVSGRRFFVFAPRLSYDRCVLLSITAKESESLIKILCLV